MTDMLKVAEAKAVGVIVKKVVKGKKQSKIPTKATKRTHSYEEDEYKNETHNTIEDRCSRK